ncbi:cytochrome d ubiquinol oxidase subunit I [Chromobacterium alkanivorans]|uniref:cytochrome ubiquinol oxidase subunit I n=1 Tax=Chromobacterium alkanivorans TaxID=1071719 RepID=UPI00216A4B62|nr:cytochrome ubiquinol oxidase subunit I [Chromobacterium alkanivorans]MCS3805979.1 cytochrome d ubiquinol oxidase subunit I [Chromobacterium alkanivorans]MCS3820317.1 cytochrome d ubiquinol oxidase subunit I [Chromobacterium alkanivorans]MCS3875075.1 cytochrome d ubiquinol oxidase subunit I [Chromobacterium alkanivorans]
MNGFDALTLARMQFGANISFHILFPSINVALGWLLLFFKLRYAASGRQGWMDAYHFWIKVFALSFALGVVSGATMSFQFGTNWPGFMRVAGNIAGPLLSYEILTAFFLEATFLGVMLFGRPRLSERAHTVATLLVAFGNTLSTFWILTLNSWMQTPAGFKMVDGHAVVSSWLQVIFNPSAPYRFAHMLIASGLTAAFLLAGLSAYRKLRGDNGAGNRLALKTGVYLAALLIPLQFVAGDLHGLKTREVQPAKLAAMEGVWRTEKAVPLLLFALPNEATRSNDYALGIPHLASLILTHRPDGEIKGLDAFPQHPPVAKVFWSFRAMVGVGVLMLLTAWLAAWRLKKRGRLPKPLLRVLVGMSFSGWIATLAGWYVSEMGRQPWLVNGVLTTAQAAGHATSAMLTSSLGMYLALYAVLVASYVAVLFHMAGKAAAANRTTRLEEKRI